MNQRKVYQVPQEVLESFRERMEDLRFREEMGGLSQETFARRYGIPGENHLNDRELFGQRIRKGIYERDLDVVDGSFSFH